ncbi:MAG: ribosomal protein S18-alanine N-acetyltransferase [Nitrosomonadales bacterium]|nr:ribosomal protein S18-alanine N-acetyltransferase [Nitrosomonadales bacterium]
MLRDMTQDDVDAVLAIEQVVQHYPWTRGNFTDALGNGYVCSVDEADGEIRGYAILMTAGEDAELLNIGVAAARQRKGLGRAMLVEMLDAACAANILRVFLEVRASNAAALALYDSAGFVRIGVRRGYYRNANGGEDAITMVCELTGELYE